MIVKIPVDDIYLRWLGSEEGWSGFHYLHRALTKASGGYKSAELVTIAPGYHGIRYLIFQLELETPKVW